MARKPKKKKIKHISLKALRKRADKLIQEYIRLKYKKCMVCNNPMPAGHHFFTKANSNALRYHISNIIPLCQSCHCLVHTQPHLVTPKISFYMGEDWYNELLDIKKQYVKANKEWYLSKIEELEGFIRNLKEDKYV